MVFNVLNSFFTCCFSICTLLQWNYSIILYMLTLQRYCTENGKKYSQKGNCAASVLNIYIHKSVIYLYMYVLYIPTIGLPILLQEKGNRLWEHINRSQIYECRNWDWEYVHKSDLLCSVLQPLSKFLLCDWSMFFTVHHLLDTVKMCINLLATGDFK